SLVVDTPKSVLKGTFVGYILTIILTVVRFHSGSLLVAKIAPKAMPVDSIAPFAALNIWPLWLGILIIVGAVGAAYTTANTQAMTIAQSIVDFYRFSVNKTATDKKLLNITRLACVVVLIVTGLVAMKKFWILAIASSLAGIIFSLGFFPVLVLSLYWKKVTRTATNIMLWASVPIGAFMILTNYFYKWFAPFPTIYSFPIGFGGLILLSYLTKPSQEEQDAYDKMQNIAFGSGGEKIVAAKSDYVTLGLGFAVIIVAAVILVSIFS
ncbi:MAG: hypothetical protein RBT20_05290, partial [Syntrophales bacterium]|nr:hypothetical protein [Syntrophales bacterium]